MSCNFLWKLSVNSKNWLKFKPFNWKFHVARFSGMMFHLPIGNLKFKWNFWWYEKWPCSSYWFDKLEEYFAELPRNLASSKINIHVFYSMLLGGQQLIESSIFQFKLPFKIQEEFLEEFMYWWHCDWYILLLVLPQAFSFPRGPTKNQCLLEKEPLLIR